MNNADIAAQLGCSVETVRSVKANDVFKRQFYEQQNAQIVELIPVAVKRLADMIKDDSVQASVHISAVKEVLDRAHLTDLLDNTDKNIKITVSYE